MVEDFVMDKGFRDWVLHRKVAQTVYWELWVDQHPEKYQVIKEARQIILILYNQFSHKTEQEVEARWEEVCN
jgi:hypothetical protein